MKKLIAVLSMVLFVSASLQDSSTVINSDSNSTIMKKEAPVLNITVGYQGGTSQGTQDPSLPRI